MASTRVYLDEKHASKLKSLYGKGEEATNRAVGGYLSLRQFALRSLRGVFTKNELIGLADAFNGHYFDDAMIMSPLDTLIIQMEDAHILERTHERQDYDGPALLDKLRALDILSAYFLLDAISQFWETPNPDLMDWVTSFSPKN